MYVPAWEEETGFPMGLGENWSSRVRIGAWIKALRASNSTNACLEILFSLMFVLLTLLSQIHFHQPTRANCTDRSLLLADLALDFPRTSGCFLKNCLMKIAESPFVARECHCDNHRGRGLSEPHPTSWNSCSLLISPFSVHSHVFLLEESWLNLPIFFLTPQQDESDSVQLTRKCRPWSPVSKEFCRPAGVKQYVGYWLLVEMWEQRGLSGGVWSHRAATASCISTRSSVHN